MELQAMPNPATSGQSRDSNGIFLSVDDYVEQEKEGYERDRQARLDAKAPKPPKVKDGDNASPVPIAVSTRSSESISRFHMKLQALGLGLPVFTFTGDSLLGWGVGAEICGESLTEPTRYSSKQAAKEALCRRGLELVDQLEAEGKVSKPVKGCKSSVANAQTAELKQPGPNNIGQLLEFRNSTQSSHPAYEDYSVGRKFACVLTLDDLDLSFGSTSSTFASKKEARQAAAGSAIEHFKAAGTWPESSTDGGGIRKKKKTTDGPKAASTSLSSEDSSSSGPSYAHKVTQLAIVLGFPAPEYRYEQNANPNAANFYKCACFFRNEGAHAGPIGETAHVFGKKNAKETCAELVLSYLEKVKEERLAFGRMMMGVSEGGKPPLEEDESHDEYVDAQG
ncbi:hypothetical protein EJ04DRAFT_461718 [Polyplosphaeria fusca]|uniref:DRBM domain-containing protein n=1 Tax=Polyplosphaeria fusca TaxID=682080 RepID=A0A9P4R0F8_9PLEO|nr:hypothetical protein EJ04DRAFT_461718 [Polyplosphaeria fusca]